MAKIKLKFDTEYFPLTKGSYKLDLQNKETVNETEAGTLIRDITVTSTIDSTWLQKLQGYYVKGSAVKIYYFSPATLAEDNYDGFIQNLSFNLLKDNGTTTYWDVSFEVTAY